MGMFDSYDNLQNHYIPNNIDPDICKPCTSTILDPIITNKPFEDINALGELIGYWWNYGDALNLEFNIDGEVVVINDDIIYEAMGQEPNIEIIGEIGQRACNIIDNKSWTCIQIDGNNYIWVQDSSYIAPQEGNRNVYVTASKFMEGKEVTVQLYNFRMELIELKTYAGSDKIIFEIDKELSKKLVKGIYYCTLTVYSDAGLNKTIVSQDNVTLTVK